MEVFLPIAEVSVNIIAIFSLSGIVGILSGLFGVGGGFSMTPYGEWHYRELEIFVKDIGMSNMDAIVCATKNASKSIKMEGKVGTIEEGIWKDGKFMYAKKPTSTSNRKIEEYKS